MVTPTGQEELAPTDSQNSPLSTTYQGASGAEEGKSVIDQQSPSAAEPGSRDCRIDTNRARNTCVFKQSPNSGFNEEKPGTGLCEEGLKISQDSLSTGLTETPRTGLTEETEAPSNVTPSSPVLPSSPTPVPPPRKRRKKKRVQGSLENLTEV